MYTPEEGRKIVEQLQPIKDLKPGDAVRWKRGLKNAKFPSYDEIIIVSRVYQEPFYNDKANPGSTYFMEPQDFVGLIRHKDGDWIEYHFDSRRFEKVDV